MRIDRLKTLLLTPVFAFIFAISANAQFEEGTQYNPLVGEITINGTFPDSNTVTIGASQGQSYSTIRNIIRLKINELAPNGSNLLFYKAGFTVTATLSVNAWLLASNNGTPDLSAAVPSTP